MNHAVRFATQAQKQNALISYLTPSAKIQNNKWRIKLNIYPNYIQILFGYNLDSFLDNSLDVL